MILIEPSAQIIAISDAPLQLIEYAGRTCYKSEAHITDESAEAFVKVLIARGHEAMLEHVQMTVKFVCDRGVSHEIVRHRLASFAQESTRYCDYDKRGVPFVIPPWVKIVDGCGTDVVSGAWLEAMQAAEDTYKFLHKMGWRPEQARSVLPNSLKTEVVMTANLREWRHFFKLRAVGTTGKPHPQIAELALPLLEKAKAVIPVVFDDIKPKEGV